MKRRFLIIPFLTLAFVLVFTLLPVSFISANPGNLAKNSSFSDGLGHWGSTSGVSIDNEAAFIDGDDDGNWYGIWQDIDTSDKNLTFSFDYKPEHFGGGSQIRIGFTLPEGTAEYYGIDTLEWHHFSEKISTIWADNYGGAKLPEFVKIQIWVGVDGDAEAYFDNVRLESSGGGEAEEEEVWVRDHEMQCWQVWINEDNAFEFVFVWEYYNNNWVKIYDMAGNEVFSIDMPKGGAHFTADLPDGMYTVKTFHEAGHILQEFVIGKP